MHTDCDAVVVADLPQGIPVAGVDAWQLEPGRNLAERDGPHSTLGVALRLGRRQFGIPEGNDAERNVDPAGWRAPLLDHPIVVGLHTSQSKLLVLALVEGLPAEAGEG